MMLIMYMVRVYDAISDAYAPLLKSVEDKSVKEARRALSEVLALSEGTNG